MVTKKKKNCSGTKGYNCGASCISVKKECRKDGLSGQSVSIATKMTDAIKSAKSAPAPVASEAPPYVIPKKSSKNLKKVGQGSFGEVFLDKNNPNVVVKYPTGDVVMGKQLNEINNQKIAADLGLAPKILAEGDNGEVAMEFKKGKYLDYKDKAQVDRALQAIRKLQKAGIAHHDSHNENWIIEDDGKVNLIDYGHSRKGTQEVEKEVLEGPGFGRLIANSSNRKAIEFRKSFLMKKTLEDPTPEAKTKFVKELLDIIDNG